MTTITMVEFRQNAERVIRRVQQGECMVLTYRGRSVARIEPVYPEEVHESDPIYKLADHADDTGQSLSNEEMDATVYGD